MPTLLNTSWLKLFLISWVCWKKNSPKFVLVVFTMIWFTITLLFLQQIKKNRSLGSKLRDVIKRNSFDLLIYNRLDITRTWLIQTDKDVEIMRFFLDPRYGFFIYNKHTGKYQHNVYCLASNMLQMLISETWASGRNGQVPAWKENREL